MHKKFALALGAVAAFALAACSNSSTGSIPSASPLAASQSNVSASCGAAAEGSARCFSLVRTDIGGGNPNGYHGLYQDPGSVEPLSVSPDRRHTPTPSPSPRPTGSPGPTPTPIPTPTPGNPPGFGPADLQSAYALPSSTNGAGQTVAIVDAYDDKTAENDLGVYRAQFGLAPCTTANGCFKKVNQTGGSTPPAANASWGQEISLDIDLRVIDGHVAGRSTMRSKVPRDRCRRNQKRQQKKNPRVSHGRDSSSKGAFRPLSFFYRRARKRRIR